jgi:predicted flap endonuclease-1-like 5' DNA nuclease
VTRGTAYAALEIILWLLAAAVVGFVIGWLLRRWRTDRHVEDQLRALRVEEDRRHGMLQQQLTESESNVAALAADLDHRTADLGRANIQMGERDKTIAKLQNDISTTRSTEMKLQAKVEDRESTIASLRESSGKEDKQLSSLKRDLDVANGTIGTLRKDAEGYRTTIEALRADLEGERRKQTELSVELEATAAEAAAAGASLSAARDARETLQARLAELETGADGAGDLDKKLAALEADLASVQQERAALASRFHDLEAEHATCAEDADPVTAVAPIAVPGPDSEEAAPPPPEDMPDKDLAVAKVAEIATRTRGDGPAVEDDLKKIHGVGPKLEKLLKGMDITSFRQVASFTTDDIGYVTAALDAFPGRIERDDWISSAAEQHTAKYDEPA